MTEHRNPNLKNKAVFTQREMSGGIPTRVFVATLLLTLFSAFVFTTYLPLIPGLACSALLALLILVPVYLVHKDDPDAYIVWLRGLFTPARFTASRISRRRMLLLTPDNNGELRVSPIFKGQNQ